MRILLCALIVMSGAGTGIGGDTYWLGGTGNWSDASYWSIGEPYSGDRAFLREFAEGTIQITEFGEQASILWVDQHATGGVVMLSGSLSTGYAVIGDWFNGTFTQSGGTHTIEQSLNLGYGAAGSSGTYHLSNGSLSAHDERIGKEGGGTFIQTGGTNTISSWLRLGHEAGAAGTYQLSDGALSASGMSVGDSGSGSSFTQTGGTNAVGYAYVGGYVSGANGWYLQTGGTNTISGDMMIGTSGGIYHLRGGALDIGGTIGVAAFLPSGSAQLYVDGGTLACADITVNIFGVGATAGATGSHSLWDGQSLVVREESIGQQGVGAFTQTGGSHAILTDLAMGQYAGSSGSYHLQGGTLSVDGSITNGAGESFLGIDGGTLSVGGGIDVDHLVFGELTGGTYTYDIVAGMTVVAGDEVVGSNRGVIVTQTGGTHTVSGQLMLGENEFGGGKYVLNGGYLQVGSVTEGPQTVWNSNLVIDGGTLDVTSGRIEIDELYVGPHATGSYTIDDGDVVTTLAETVGGWGTGTMTQTGGTHSIAQFLRLGYRAGGSGTYRLQGGTLSVADIVNGVGTGALYIDGGVLQAPAVDVDTLGVGYEAGRTGSHSLWDGQSLVVREESIGQQGVGAFTQTGGSHAILTDLAMGQYAGSSGSYHLQGGTLSVDGSITNGAGESFLGIDGGTLSVGGGIDVDHLVFGELTGGTYTYDIVAGMTVVAGDEVVGSNRGVIVTQTGGTHTVSGQLMLGENEFGGGKYVLNGGYLQVGSVTEGPQTVWNSNLVIDGGTLDVTSGRIEIDELYVGPHATGSYTIDDGDVVTTLAETVGGWGTGTMTQTGGTHSIAQFLRLGYRAGGSGTYRLQGGTLSVADIVNGVGTGALYIDGGVLQAPAVDVDTLGVGYEAGRSGSHTLSAGQALTAEGLILGYAGQGVFYQEGGSLVVTVGVVLGLEASSDGQYTLNDGQATAPFLGIGGQGSGVFLQTGGVLNTESVYLAGDPINGPATGQGQLAISGGQCTVDAALRVWDNGQVLLSGGFLEISGNLELADAATFDFTGGRLEVIDVVGDLTNTAGALAVYDSSGRLGVDGDYTQLQNAFLEMVIGGTVPVVDYNVLDVSGELTPGGTLRVFLSDGFLPTEGDRFDILNWGMIALGHQFTLDLPALPTGLAWDTSALYDTGVLAAEVPEPTSMGLLSLGGLMLLRRRKSEILRKREVAV